MHPQLFILNITDGTLSGVYEADGRPALDIVPDAWLLSGRRTFPAQIRIRKTGIDGRIQFKASRGRQPDGEIVAANMVTKSGRMTDPEHVALLERLLLASMPANHRPDRLARTAAAAAQRSAAAPATAPALAPAPAAQEAFDGFMFVADDSTVSECIAAEMFGNEEAMLATMRRIGPTTLLFIHNRTTEEVHGAFEGTGPASANIRPGFVTGSAQIKVRRTQPSSQYSTITPT